MAQSLSTVSWNQLWSLLAEGSSILQNLRTGMHLGSSNRAKDWNIRRIRKSSLPVAHGFFCVCFILLSCSHWLSLSYLVHMAEHGCHLLPKCTCSTVGKQGDWCQASSPTSRVPWGRTYWSSHGHLFTWGLWPQVGSCCRLWQSLRQPVEGEGKGKCQTRVVRYTIEQVPTSGTAWAWDNTVPL